MPREKLVLLYVILPVAPTQKYPERGNRGRIYRDGTIQNVADEISRILKRSIPRGTVIVTVSPFFLPINP